MTLHSVIIADDSVACNIADLCVQLKDSTARSLNQYKTSHPGVGLNSNECLSSNVTKLNLSERELIPKTSHAFGMGMGNSTPLLSETKRSLRRRRTITFSPMLSFTPFLA